MNILFVCTGNTCRSPMAEGYLRSKGIDGVTVSSRGLVADGSPVSPNSKTAMAEVGIDIAAHISRQITADDINKADKIDNGTAINNDNNVTNIVSITIKPTP